MSPELQEVLDQLSSGSTEALSRYCSQQRELSWPDDEHITQALAATATARWPDTNRTLEIAEFARRINEYDNLGIIISPLFAEAVIRSALGESHLTNELPIDYRIPWTLALIAILSKIGHSPAPERTS